MVKETLRLGVNPATVAWRRPKLLPRGISSCALLPELPWKARNEIAGAASSPCFHRATDGWRHATRRGSPWINALVLGLSVGQGLYERAVLVQPATFDVHRSVLEPELVRAVKFPAPSCTAHSHLTGRIPAVPRPRGHWNEDGYLELQGSYEEGPAS